MGIDGHARTGLSRLLKRSRHFSFCSLSHEVADLILFFLCCIRGRHQRGPDERLFEAGQHRRQKNVHVLIRYCRRCIT